MRTGLAVAVLGVGAFVAAPASAIVIQLDFTHDTFFNSNTTARNTLLAAAADISSAITTNLNATTDTNSGAFGTMSVDYNHTLAYANPSNGSVVLVANAALPANVVKVYVGHRNLTGATLAQGGPAILAEIDLGGSGTDLGDIQGAVNAADAAATANLRRGGGPIMGTYSDTFNLEGIPQQWHPDFSVSYGALMGHLWFDSDIDNNSITDPGILNSGVWHYDHTTAPAAGKLDLYSIALHEMLHAVGIGVSETWDENVSGGNWLGAAVSELRGNGLNVIDPAQKHIAENLMSRPLNNLGALQEVVMSPTIDVGERRYLTELDLAFLRDINWDTVVVPEPAAAMLLLAPLALVSRRARKSRA